MRNREQRGGGFTLVELLVVVVIIGMLVGLLLPAVQKIRAKAYVTKCQNNQDQIAKALLSFTNTHDRFPGYFTSGGLGGIWNCFSWPEVIAPEMGRQDLYDRRLYRKDYNFPKSGYEEMYCPVDSDALLEDEPLSYLVNYHLVPKRGRWMKLIDITLNDIESKQQTVLVGERLGSGPWMPHWIIGRRTDNQPWQKLTFGWEAPKTTPTDPCTYDLYDPNELFSSNHPGGVVVAFCDGSVKFMNEDADWSAIHIYPFGDP